MPSPPPFRLRNCQALLVPAHKSTHHCSWRQQSEGEKKEKWLVGWFLTARLSTFNCNLEVSTADGNSTTNVQTRLLNVAYRLLDRVNLSLEAQVCSSFVNWHPPGLELLPRLLRTLLRSDR